VHYRLNPRTGRLNSAGIIAFEDFNKNGEEGSGNCRRAKKERRGKTE